MGWELWSLAVAGILLIGIAKAGFGGGLGMLTTPLCVLAFGAGGQGPTFAIGVLLPLLIVGDAFSFYHYWKCWDARNLKFLLPGVVIGVVIGIQFIGIFSARQFNLVIGVLAVAFVMFHLTKEQIFRWEGSFQPNYAIGAPCGVVAGITSTFAHGAGPVVSVFLIPQNLPKKRFVGTNVLIFTVVNWIKVPFYCMDRELLGFSWLPAQSIINADTLWTSLLYLPLVPVGVWLGLWLHDRVNEIWFRRMIYAFTILAGLQLIFDFSLGDWFRGVVEDETGGMIQ